MSERVVDDGNMRRYRTEIPNLIDDWPLSIWAKVLYHHYKRVAGDNGQCRQGMRSCAERLGISLGQVSKARKELAENGLIQIEVGNRETPDIIRITDIWPINFQAYGPAATLTPAEAIACIVAGVHTVNTYRLRCSPGEQRCSPGEREEEPIKKNLVVVDSDPGGSSDSENLRAHARTREQASELAQAFDVADIQSPQARTAILAAWPDIEPLDVLAWAQQRTADNMHLPRQRQMGVGALVEALKAGRRARDDCYDIDSQMIWEIIH